MKTIVFNSIQIINYWFTLHRALRSLYQQAQIFSPNIQGISDQDVTSNMMFCQCFTYAVAGLTVLETLTASDILHHFTFVVRQNDNDFTALKTAEMNEYN